MFTHRRNLRYVVVDYLQEIGTEEGKDHRKSMVSWLRILKKIAEDKKLALIVASQITRDVEFRKDQRPLLSDFKPQYGLNFIDNLWYVFRPLYYHKYAKSSLAELIVAKSKLDGPHSRALQWIQRELAFRF